jgi:hypothetical protein
MGQEVSPAASGGGRAEVGAKLKGAGKLRLVNECDKRRVDDARRVQIIKKACVDRQIGRGQGGRAAKEGARDKKEAAVSGENLRQVSGVKWENESAYDVRDGTCENGDRSGRGPDSGGG